MKYLLIFILIIFSLSYIFRMLFPWMLKRAAKRMQDQYGAYSNTYRAQQKEGDVELDNSRQPGKAKKKVAKNVGDYVDYEEVK